MSLASLKHGYRAAVFGASGGIGTALVRLLAEDPRCAQVYAGARQPRQYVGKITPFAFDLNHESGIAAAAADIAANGEIDLVIAASGVLHAPSLQPEKTIRALDPEALMLSYRINAIGPALIAKHMLGFLPRDRKGVFAALSARVGSIGDNRTGGWHAYRASKAALNQLIRTAAIELHRRNPHAVCALLHPGTVDTAMSKPFQGAVPSEKLFNPETSAAYLLQVIENLSPADSGGFFAWDGAPIPF